MSDTKPARGYAKIENHILRCNRLNHVQFRVLMVLMSWTNGSVYNPFNASYQQLAAAMGYKPLAQKREDGKDKYDTSRVRQTIEQLVAMGAIRKAVVVKCNDAPLVAKPKGNRKANHYVLVPAFFEGEEGRNDPTAADNDRVSGTLSVGSSGPYQQGPGDPMQQGTVGSGGPSRISEGPFRNTSTNNEHACAFGSGVVAGGSEPTLNLEQDGDDHTQSKPDDRIPQPDPEPATTPAKKGRAVKTKLPKATTKSVSPYAAKLAAAIWRNKSLPVGNMTVTLLSIATAADTLLRELGEPEFMEICELAFSNRAAKSWGPSGAQQQQLDWMFKTKSGEPVPNLIKAASGGMNWLGQSMGQPGQCIERSVEDKVTIRIGGVEI